MENKSIISHDEINEYIIVYPPIRQINDSSDTKEYLSLFSKAPKRNSLVMPFEFRQTLKKRKRSNNSFNLEKEDEKHKELDLEQNINQNEKYNIFLINKDIELRKAKSKRTQDIKHALESFFRKSDLIERLTKFFEEFRDNLMKIKKSKSAKKDKKEGLRNEGTKKEGIKNEGEKKEEENEKIIESYIDSVVSKLAENVVIEKYKKNKFIVKMNEIGDSCYFLLSGKLSVLKPVEYHIEITYDDYMKYIVNLLKYNEQEIIENIRHVNQNFIDIGLVQDLQDFIKSYFIIKLNKDINYLFKNNNFDFSFIQTRLEKFNLSLDDFNLSMEEIEKQMDKINKLSLKKEKDLQDYFNKITTPKEDDFKRMETNPHIFEEDKHKISIFKYEDFLYLKPGSFFGETALESNVNKRNASIRTEEDCIILSLKNKVYKTLLLESNKKLKSFDVIFICRNFFFNDISPIIFDRRYFPLFKLVNKIKGEKIYEQNDPLTSVYFIKEGNVKMEINVSMIEIYNSIKKYFDILTNNPFLKCNQSEIKEIKEFYIEDINIINVRHQNPIFKEKLRVKRKFELYSSNLFDTLGLEEFFLNNGYLCSCKVISNEAKIFEISIDSLNLIIEK